MSIASADLRSGLASDSCDKPVSCADYSQLADEAVADENFILAAKHLQQALLLAPDDLNLIFRRAHCLQNGGEIESAIDAYEYLINIQPNLASVQNNLGNAYASSGKLDKALTCLQQVTKIEPGYPDGYANLGNVLHRLGRYEEAEAAVCDAIGLDAQNPTYWYNLGNVLQTMQRFDDAIRCYRRSIRFDGNFAGCFNNLGNIYRALGQYSNALPAFEKAVSLDSDSAETYANLGGLCSDAGEHALARKYYEKALLLDPDCISAFSNLLYLLNYVKDEPTVSLLDSSIEWGERFAPTGRSRQHAENHAVRGEFTEEKGTSTNRSCQPTLRVGFVSPDFRRHSVAFFFEALLDGNNPDTCEIICYSNVSLEDEITQRIKNKSNGWRSIVTLSDREAADLIKRDNIDVLVDLAGHTSGNRLQLFALRPAPVQVSWLGYPNTTGVTDIDYRITDSVADPVPHDAIHSERLVRLDSVFLCYRPDETAPPVAPLPMLENGYVTFGCFNNISKITDEVVQTWVSLLKNVPDSRLLVKSKLFEDDQLRPRFESRFVDCGIAPERLELVGRTATFSEHMKSYEQVDIALDTFPYNGTTTTCESLWMGVPVLGVFGCSHRSRVTLSISQQIGLGSLIVDKPEKLVALASSLSHSSSTLIKLRAELRARLIRSDLCHSQRFAKSLESAFRRMCSAVQVD